MLWSRLDSSSGWRSGRRPVRRRPIPGATLNTPQPFPEESTPCAFSGGNVTKMSDTLSRLDMLDLDSELDPESRLMRDTVRKFADDRLRPHIRDWFEEGSLPARELAQEF